jgi:ABC-type branched-subunit amino acid transport system substrate-binding protein
MTKTAARTLDRRRFVQLVGAGAGIAVAGPLVSDARAATGIALKVGVMTPSGSSYANMGKSLLDGLSLGFDGARSGATPVNATLVRRDIDRGFGGAQATAQALLDDGADVVVAGISALTAARIAELFGTRQSPLVVANVGAHVVQPGAKNAYVLYDSLLYWQASYSAGRWAAANVGKKAFLAASLCDAGYDTIYAFRRGFESAGGTIVGDAVTHVDLADRGLSALFAAVRSSGADLVYALYSGADATQLVHEYAGAGLGAKLVTGSLAVEDYSLRATGGSAVGTMSVASWTASRSTNTNRLFTKAFKTRTGRAADPFAALGYDAAAFVAEGARRATKQGLGLRRLIDALAGVSLETARGTLTIDSNANTVTGPLWVRQVKRTTTGLANADVSHAPAVGRVPNPLSPLADGPVAGYVNEYLCA